MLGIPTPIIPPPPHLAEGPPPPYHLAQLPPTSSPQANSGDAFFSSEDSNTSNKVQVVVDVLEEEVELDEEEVEPEEEEHKPLEQLD